MYYLIYKSAANDLIEHSVAKSILEKSITNNVTLIITGMLFIVGVFFVQVLESQAEVV